jgi:hypothetical protein
VDETWNKFKDNNATENSAIKNNMALFEEFEDELEKIIHGHHYKVKNRSSKAKMLGFIYLQ